MELAAKIEDAFTAYLRAQVQQAIGDEMLPAYFDPATQIQPGQSDTTIEGQLIRSVCPDASEEMPLGSGNFTFDIMIELLTPVDLPSEADADSGDPALIATALEKHQAVAQVLEPAIMVDDLPAQLNAIALALGSRHTLTVFGITNREPQRGAPGDKSYLSGFKLRLYACGSTL